MSQGVHVFEVIDAKHIDKRWVRDVLGVSRHRLRRLRLDEALFTPQEVEVLVKAMRETHNIGRSRLFDKDADILPPGRRRRRKGTVTKEITAA